MKKEKTYSEKEGAKPFDWKKFLSKDFTKRNNQLHIELTDASDIAASWVTCACGNQCAIIPRDKASGAPKNKDLRRLGEIFAIDINALLNAFENSEDKYVVIAQEKCQDTLERIEILSAAIINFMKNPNKKMITKKRK